MPSNTAGRLERRGSSRAGQEAKESSTRDSAGSRPGLRKPQAPPGVPTVTGFPAVIARRVQGTSDAARRRRAGTRLDFVQARRPAGIALLQIAWSLAGDRPVPICAAARTTPRKAWQTDRRGAPLRSNSETAGSFRVSTELSRPPQAGLSGKARPCECSHSPPSSPETAGIVRAKRAAGKS